MKFVPSCMTKPSITCVRTCGLTIAFGGTCLLFAVTGTETGIAADSSLAIPLVIELIVFANPAKGLLQDFSSAFEGELSSSFIGTLHWSASMYNKIHIN